MIPVWLELLSKTSQSIMRPGLENNMSVSKDYAAQAPQVTADGKSRNDSALRRRYMCLTEKDFNETAVRSADSYTCQQLIIKSTVRSLYAGGIQKVVSNTFIISEFPSMG